MKRMTTIDLETVHAINDKEERLKELDRYINNKRLSEIRSTSNEHKRLQELDQYVYNLERQSVAESDTRRTIDRLRKVESRSTRLGLLEKRIEYLKALDKIILYENKCLGIVESIGDLDELVEDKIKMSKYREMVNKLTSAKNKYEATIMELLRKQHFGDN